MDKDYVTVDIRKLPSPYILVSVVAVYHVLSVTLVGSLEGLSHAPDSLVARANFLYSGAVMYASCLTDAAPRYHNLKHI